MRDIPAGKRVRLNYQRYPEAYRDGTASVLSYDQARKIYTIVRDANTTVLGNAEPVTEDDWPHWHVFTV